MKSVLISIKPKYCEMIADGKKTIEVRKSRPKLQPPFKVYIYQTKYFVKNKRYRFKTWARSGKVIGEFVCDCIDEFSVFENGAVQNYNFFDLEKSCLPYEHIASYIGKNKKGYGWHISELKIYDKPKELRDFYSACPEWEKEEITNKCHKCSYLFKNDSDMCYQCSIEGEKPIKRPPQSWCYVEELKE